MAGRRRLFFKDFKVRLDDAFRKYAVKTINNGIIGRYNEDNFEIQYGIYSYEPFKFVYNGGLVLINGEFYEITSGYGFTKKNSEQHLFITQEFARKNILSLEEGLPTADIPHAHLWTLISDSFSITEVIDKRIFVNDTARQFFLHTHDGISSRRVAYEDLAFAKLWVIDEELLPVKFENGFYYFETKRDFDLIQVFINGQELINQFEVVGSNSIRIHQDYYLISVDTLKVNYDYYINTLLDNVKGYEHLDLTEEVNQIPLDIPETIDIEKKPKIIKPKKVLTYAFSAESDLSSPVYISTLENVSFVTSTQGYRFSTQNYQDAKVSFFQISGVADFFGGWRFASDGQNIFLGASLWKPFNLDNLSDSSYATKKLLKINHSTKEISLVGDMPSPYRIQDLYAKNGDLYWVSESKIYKNLDLLSSRSLTNPYLGIFVTDSYIYTLRTPNLERFSFDGTLIKSRSIIGDGLTDQEVSSSGLVGMNYPPNNVTPDEFLVYSAKSGATQAIQLSYQFSNDQSYGVDFNPFTETTPNLDIATSNQYSAIGVISLIENGERVIKLKRVDWTGNYLSDIIRKFSELVISPIQTFGNANQEEYDMLAYSYPGTGGPDIMQLDIDSNENITTGHGSSVFTDDLDLHFDITEALNKFMTETYGSYFSNYYFSGIYIEAISRIENTIYFSARLRNTINPTYQWSRITGFIEF